MGLAISGFAILFAQKNIIGNWDGVGIGPEGFCQHGRGLELSGFGAFRKMIAYNRVLKWAIHIGCGTDPECLSSRGPNDASWPTLAR